MDNKRQEIIDRLNIVEAQEKVIREELNAFDYDNKFKEASQYIGKYYKEINDSISNYNSVFFVHGIKKETCELDCIHVSYWIDNDDWYSIENHSYFNLKEWDGKDKYVEITDEDFIKHYNEAQRRIKLIIIKSK